MTSWICLAPLLLATFANAKLSLPNISPEIVEDLSAYLIDIFQYENPIDRDHFIWTGLDTNTTFPHFHFENYRFDGYVATVMSQQGYNFLKEKAPKALPYVMNVYHGYHEDMKHNYFSKPFEPYFEGPVFYCPRIKNFLNATLDLWTLDGQPVDVNGNLGYDTIYTNDLVERDLPNVEDYVMYRVLCYTWPHPDTPNEIIKAQPKFEITEPYAHGIREKLTRLYEYFDENNQDHYYKTTFDHKAEEDRANFVKVVGYVADKDKFKTIETCGVLLVELISAYNKDGTDSSLFLGRTKLEEVQKAEGITFENVQTLGYVISGKDDGCHGRYQLNIRVHLNKNLYQKGNTTDQGLDFKDRDVYVAPNNFNTTDELYHGQVFYIW